MRALTVARVLKQRRLLSAPVDCLVHAIDDGLFEDWHEDLYKRYRQDKNSWHRPHALRRKPPTDSYGDLALPPQSVVKPLLLGSAPTNHYSMEACSWQRAGGGQRTRSVQTPERKRDDPCRPRNRNMDRMYRARRIREP